MTGYFINVKIIVVCFQTYHASLVLQRQRIRLQRRRRGFDPWVGKIPWRRQWQPIPVFLPGESRGQRSLAGYSPWGRKESGTTERVQCSPGNEPRVPEVGAQIISHWIREVPTLYILEKEKKSA